MTSQRTIKDIFSGDYVLGGRVHESIGRGTEVEDFSPFLRCDDYTSQGDHGFPEHPHAGMETITYCLLGAVAHEDLTGSKGILYPGDLQFMTAGKGTVHSEMPVSTKDLNGVRLLQIWVDLPEAEKDCEPRYKDLREWEIPTVSKQDGKLKVKVISGTSYGVKLNERIATTPAELYHFIMEKGSKFTQKLNPNYRYFLYTIKGNGLVLNGCRKVAENKTAFFNDDGGDYFTGEHKGDDGDTTEFILVGGRKLNQEIVLYGPFVATSMAGIRQKFADYEQARNGFARIRQWKSLISNGVTEAMVNGPLEGSLQAREETRRAFLAQASK